MAPTGSPGEGFLLTSRAYCRQAIAEGSIEEAGASLHKSDEQDIVAEWQRLLRRWELVYSDYTAVREKTPTVDGQSGTTTDDAAIERAHLNLIQIKEQIDKLISESARTRAASRDRLQFAFIETKLDSLLVEMAKARAEMPAREPKTQPAPSTRSSR